MNRQMTRFAFGSKCGIRSASGRLGSIAGPEAGLDSAFADWPVTIDASDKPAITPAALNKNSRREVLLTTPNGPRQDRIGFAI
jgi:hypothetical protein